jgi:hypothetical protein
MMLQTYEDVLLALPLLLSPSDVAAALDISINYARDLFRSGAAFPTILLGKRRFVARVNFLDWLESIEEAQS